MKEPYTPGTPRPKRRSRGDQAAEAYPMFGEGRTSSVITDEFIVLFPGISDYLRSKMTLGQMEKMIQDERRKRHATADAKAKADRDAKKKADGRFPKLNQFTDHGIEEAKLSMPAQIVWYHLYRHERDGVARASIDEIRQKHNMSKRAVYDGIAELKKAGMVEILERGNSRSKCSKYRLLPSPLKESATSAPGAPVEQSATSAPGALTGAPGALTGAPGALTGAGNDTPTEGQKVSGPSVLRRQNGQSDPAAVRSETARPVLPASQTNSDGGTIPLSPPSTSAHEGEPSPVDPETAFRAKVKTAIRLSLAGLSMEAAKHIVVERFGDDDLHRQWAMEEINEHFSKRA